MSFLIQKPVLIAVRFMSITRNSVSVCINIAMCHSHLTLLSLIHPGVVLLCLSSMPVHPPCAAPIQVPLPDQPSLAFLLLSFFRTFIFFPLCHAVEQCPFIIYWFFLFVDFFFGWIIERWTLKALRYQINFCSVSFVLISLFLYYIKTYYCF